MNTLDNPAAKLIEKTYGFRIPEHMQDEFTQLVTSKSTKVKHDLSAEELNELFCNEYIENLTPFEITAINFEKEFLNTEQERLRCRASIKRLGHNQEVQGVGNGTLNALANAFNVNFDIELEVVDYLQHGLTRGSHALAASYIQLDDKQHRHYWGVGIDSDCTLSAIRALLSALNRSQRMRAL